MLLLGRPDDPMAFWAKVRGRIRKVRVQLRQIYLVARFKARCAKMPVGFGWRILGPVVVDAAAGPFMVLGVVSLRPQLDLL